MSSQLILLSIFTLILQLEEPIEDVLSQYKGCSFGYCCRISQNRDDDISNSHCLLQEQCTQHESISEDHPGYGMCVHKRLFPATSLEIVGQFVMFIAFALATAGGIGGGGVTVPVNLIFLNFPFSNAVSLSKISIFAAASIRYMMEICQRSPLKGQEHIPIIDQEVAMMFEPTLLTGTVMGVLLNIWLPEQILLTMLIITLGANSQISYKKGYEMRLKENLVLNREYTADTTGDLLNVDEDEIENTDMREVSEEDQFLVDRWDKENRQMVPPYRFGIILLTFVTLMIQAQIRGQPTKPLWLWDQCNTGSWVTFAVFNFINVGIVLSIWKRLKAEERAFENKNWKRKFKWTTCQQIKYLAITQMGGVLAGSLGIAGGLLMGPILLILGLDPRVSTATSNFMGVFTACSTSFQYTLLGLVDFNYAWFTMLIASCASLTGVSIIKKLVERSGRRSQIVFVLATVLLLSFVSLPTITWIKIYHQQSEGVDVWAFRDFCVVGGITG